MIFQLFRRTLPQEPVYAIYSAIVAEARQPVFYAQWGVPDTVTGRFDMISLHLGLLFHRLRGERRADAFAQAVFDLLFHDMDRSLREMGVTDIGVPKKIEKMGNIFYGLLAALSSALAAGDIRALEATLKRNIYGGDDHAGIPQLAAYLQTRSRHLAATPAEDLVAGRLPNGDVS